MNMPRWVQLYQMGLGLGYGGPQDPRRAHGYTPQTSGSVTDQETLAQDPFPFRIDRGIPVKPQEVGAMTRARILMALNDNAGQRNTLTDRERYDRDNYGKAPFLGLTGPQLPVRFTSPYDFPLGSANSERVVPLKR